MADDLFQEDNWSHLLRFNRCRNYVVVWTLGGAFPDYSVSNGTGSDESTVLRSFGNVGPFAEYIDILPNRPAATRVTFSSPEVNPGQAILVVFTAYRHSALSFAGSDSLEEALLKPPDPQYGHFPRHGFPVGAPGEFAGYSVPFPLEDFGGTTTLVLNPDAAGILKGFTINGVFTPVSWEGIE